MKTPEEIKTWLRKHDSLAYNTIKKKEALEYIEYLEAQLAKRNNLIDVLEDESDENT